MITRCIIQYKTITRCAINRGLLKAKSRLIAKCDRFIYAESQTARWRGQGRAAWRPLEHPGTSRRAAVEPLDCTRRFVFFSRRRALRFNRHDIYIGGLKAAHARHRLRHGCALPAFVRANLASFRGIGLPRPTCGVFPRLLYIYADA